MKRSKKGSQSKVRTLGEVRTSQVVTTYGVGSIVPVGDESFMMAGLDRWIVGEREEIHEARLEQQLRVSRFYLPPSGHERGDIPVVRFPEWHYCPSCRRLEAHNYFCSSRYDNTCNKCNVRLVPSRFVAACGNGHIQDFPYFSWVHAGHGDGSRSGGHELLITAAGASASLRNVVVSCSCGVASRSMEGAFASTALRGVSKCRGERPWLGDREGDCGEALRTLQRGASNVYFSLQRSALSIPPWSEEGYKLLSKAWSEVKHIVRDHPDAALAVFEGKLNGPWKGADVTAEEMLQISRDRLDRESAEEKIETSPEYLREQEYVALSHGKEGGGENQDFVAVPAEIDHPSLQDWFDQVTIVKRLREVRAVEGFTRLLPYTPGEPDERRASLFRDDPDWRPAIEVIGEGIFLRLRKDSLVDWETLENVQIRASGIHENLTRRFVGLGLEPTQSVTPRLLLLHSLAHSLINQWSLDCGYPTASLRERLYVSDSMAGLLIYTATTDSAGSLGGVIAQAESGRLATTFLRAVNTSRWCSADPVCIETEAAGVDSLNLAACHSCLLLPETSCEHSNIFLDRGLMVGTPQESTLGLYHRLVGGLHG